MSILHHPGEDLILAYASGASDEAVSLLMATHLTFCPQCRRAVARVERLGGQALETVEPVAISQNALAATLARLDAGAPVRHPPHIHDNTPAPLRPYLGGALKSVRWRSLGASLAFLPLFRRDGVSVKLLRGVPGADTGLHSHGGMEFTLVLQGGYSDETGSYARGDVQIASADVWHSPKADPGEDCINLSVTTAPLLFKGLVPTIAGKLFGF
jgi:putative transcriptional regulator